MTDTQTRQVSRTALFTLLAELGIQEDPKDISSITINPYEVVVTWMPRNDSGHHHLVDDQLVTATSTYPIAGP